MVLQELYDKDSTLVSNKDAMQKMRSRRSSRPAGNKGTASACFATQLMTNKETEGELVYTTAKGRNDQCLRLCLRSER